MSRKKCAFFIFFIAAPILFDLQKPNRTTLTLAGIIDNKRLRNINVIYFWQGSGCEVIRHIGQRANFYIWGWSVLSVPKKSHQITIPHFI